MASPLPPHPQHRQLHLKEFWPATEARLPINEPVADFALAQTQIMSHTAKSVVNRGECLWELIPLTVKRLHVYVTAVQSSIRLLCPGRSLRLVIDRNLSGLEK